MSFVYHNWLELPPRSPEGRIDIANNLGRHWGRQSQQHKTALTSRRARVVADSLWTRVEMAGEKTVPQSKTPRNGTPTAPGQLLHNGFLKPVLPELLKCLFKGHVSKFQRSVPLMHVSAISALKCVLLIRVLSALSREKGGWAWLNSFPHSLRPWPPGISKRVSQAVGYIGSDFGHLSNFLLFIFISLS